jgi:hypothetical protein
MNEKPDFNTLFKEIMPILSESRDKQQERRERGEDFNIFRTMRMQYDEVHTHSAVISALLNPIELHGCKTAFLEAFISQINVLKKYKDNIDDASVEVEVEKSIGNLSQNKENGGRLDIFIKFMTKDVKSPIMIIIENKIYAADEEKQLIRYRNYAERECCSKFYILYLTLDGRLPDDYSAGKLKQGEDYYCISYCDDILNWLSDCQQKANGKPLVHGIITQYKDLVLTLTHQDMDKETQRKLATEIVENHEYMIVASAINNNYGQILNQMCEKNLRPLYKRVAEDNDMNCHYYGNSWVEKNSGADFKKESWKHLAVGFEFVKERLNCFCYGVKYQNNQGAMNQKAYKIVQDEFDEFEKSHYSTWWPWYIQDDKYLNWTCEEAINALYDGTMQKHIDFILKEIAEKVDKIEQDMRNNE